MASTSGQAIGGSAKAGKRSAKVSTTATEPTDNKKEQTRVVVEEEFAAPAKQNATARPSPPPPPPPPPRRRVFSCFRFLIVALAYMYATGLLTSLIDSCNSRFWLRSPAHSMSQWMNASAFEQGGATSAVLKRMIFPRPVRGPKQLMVRVIKAAGNPVDFKMRQRPVFPLKSLPSISGYDFAGIVIDADKDSEFKIGQRVFGMIPATSPKWGTFADFLAVDEQFTAVIPEGVSFSEAAATPLAGLTALQALAILGPVTENRTVLIHAGSGGVGSFLIQLAKKVLKLKVYTTSTNVELCRSLGADVVIDYKKERFEDTVEKYDYIIDTMGGDYLLRGMNKAKYHYVSILNTGWQDYFGFTEAVVPGEFLSIVLLNARHFLTGGAYSKYTLAIVDADGPSTKVLGDLIQQGVIRVLLDEEFSGLEEGARKVHDRLQSGRAKGKVTLAVADV